jgi:hypothetical protein
MEEPSPPERTSTAESCSAISRHSRFVAAPAFLNYPSLVCKEIDRFTLRLSDAADSRIRHPAADERPRDRTD